MSKPLPSPASTFRSCITTNDHLLAAKSSGLRIGSAAYGAVPVSLTGTTSRRPSPAASTWRMSPGSSVAAASARVSRRFLIASGELSRLPAPRSVSVAASSAASAARSASISVSRSASTSISRSASSRCFSWPLSCGPRVSAIRSTPRPPCSVPRSGIRVRRCAGDHSAIGKDNPGIEAAVARDAVNQGVGRQPARRERREIALDAREIQPGPIQVGLDPGSLESADVAGLFLGFDLLPEGITAGDRFQQRTLPIRRQRGWHGWHRHKSQARVRLGWQQPRLQCLPPVPTAIDCRCRRSRDWRCRRRPPQAVRASKASAVHTSRRSEDRTGGARSAIECCIGFQIPPDETELPAA